MKVTFKLSVTQAKRAAEMIKKLEKQFGQDGWYVQTGNLSWPFQESAKQVLNFNPVTSQMTYEGGRTTLSEGSAFALKNITEIAGHKGLESLKVVEYTTTEPILKWWETMSDVIDRVALPKLVEVAKKHKYDWVGTEAIERLRKLSNRHLAGLLAHGKSALISAQYTSSEVSTERLIQSALADFADFFD